MTLQCQFTRFVQVYPCARHDAEATARHLMSFISTFGFPETVSSDPCAHLSAELVKNLCKMLNIKQVLHVPYRPEASGTIERLHRTLKSGIWALAYDQGLDWEEVIAPVVFATGRWVPPFSVYWNFCSIKLLLFFLFFIAF
jgi:transposase InsO family protein